jgi:hypothetical protein
MEFKTANSKYLKNIYPDVYIENITISLGERMIPSKFSWWSWKIKREVKYEYRSYLHTNLRIQRKSDNKWFLVRCVRSYDSRTNTIEEIKQLLQLFYSEIYRNLIFFIIPEEDEFSGNIGILLDENQETEEERLKLDI